MRERVSGKSPTTGAHSTPKPSALPFNHAAGVVRDLPHGGGASVESPGAPHSFSKPQSAKGGGMLSVDECVARVAVMLDECDRAFLRGHRDGWRGLDLKEDSDRYWDGYGHGARAGALHRGEPDPSVIVSMEITAEIDGKTVNVIDELRKEIYGV